MHVKMNLIRKAHDRSVRRVTRVFVARIIQLEDVGKEDVPSNPSSSRVERGLDPALGGVVDLDTAFQPFRNDTPNGIDRERDDVWDEVNENGDVPGDEDVGGGPEEPGRDGICDISAVLGAVGLKVVDAEDDRSGNEEAGGNSGSN